MFAKCIIGEAGALANFSAQGVAAFPARVFFLLDRVLRAFLASASLASACLLASVQLGPEPIFEGCPERLRGGWREMLPVTGGGRG